MPRIRTPRAPAPEPLKYSPPPVIIPHVYRDIDPGGFVLPHKRYTLDLPEAAAGAVAAHVAVIPAENAPCHDFRAVDAIVVDGQLRLEFTGNGVAGGISVLFHVP